MAYFSQQLINALTLGAIYGLIAIGYTMVYGIIGMINFAHGEVFMIGAFISLIGFMIWALLGIGSAPLAIAARAADGHDLHRRLRLGDRAHGLSPVARLVPAGAADLRHRHVDLPAELRPARCRARGSSRAARSCSGGFNLFSADGFDVRVSWLQIIIVMRHGGADGGLHLADRRARRSAASSAPASRT